AVVNTEGQADELRQDGRAAAPDLNDLVAARGPRRIRLLQHVPVDERAFPERTSHGLPPLLEMTRADDELVRRLVGTGLLALGRLAPRGHRVTTTGGAAFAAAMRVIDRVHGDATVDRLAAEPAIAASLADRGVGVVLIGHRADRREARAMHAALLARIEAQDRPTLVAADILGIGAGRAGNLGTLLRLHLDVVHDGADRHALERHRIARLHVGLAQRGHHLVAGGKPLRGNDVSLLAVLILDEGDERGAIGIVFQPLDRRHGVVAGAAEVDDAIRPLVAAAAMERGDAPAIVAPTLGGLALGQGLDRRAIPQFRAIGGDELASAGGRRIVSFETHCFLLPSDARRDVDRLAVG